MNLKLHYSIVLKHFQFFSRFIPYSRQLSICSNDTLLLNDDIDPYSNMYNQLHNTCNYHLPSNVKRAIERLEIQNNLLILHVNAVTWKLSAIIYILLWN